MEIFFTILIMTLVVSLSGVITRVLPFQLPLPLMQIAIGALLAWPTFGLHVEFDPELFLVLFIPPLLFADGWKTPTREFLEHGREILGLALALVVITALECRHSFLKERLRTMSIITRKPKPPKVIRPAVVRLSSTLSR